MKSKILTTAALAGLLAVGSAFASPAKTADDGKTPTTKSGCSGMDKSKMEKSSCSGKDSCKGKSSCKGTTASSSSAAEDKSGCSGKDGCSGKAK